MTDARKVAEAWHDIGGFRPGQRMETAPRRQAAKPDEQVFEINERSRIRGRHAHHHGNDIAAIRRREPHFIGGNEREAHIGGRHGTVAVHEFAQRRHDIAGLRNRELVLDEGQRFAAIVHIASGAHTFVAERLEAVGDSVDRRCEEGKCAGDAGTDAVASPSPFAARRGCGGECRGSSRLEPADGEHCGVSVGSPVDAVEVELRAGLAEVAHETFDVAALAVRAQFDVVADTHGHLGDDAESPEAESGGGPELGVVAVVDLEQPAVGGDERDACDVCREAGFARSVAVGAC
ncbi:hypothetical protein EG850_02520 [Gulosibacter macacae]|uniref:Uncharacterized protein n=1 Tax=Gulosibacter macacae TaxID=2488791 RepID=A0A3P3W6P1_9MICO|nr:hypothetical protein EG850_02520 [Gulosibacter macacae]